MFVASKMSGESLPFVSQNKKTAKLPEMLIQCFVSIQCTKVHALVTKGCKGLQKLTVT